MLKWWLLKIMVFRGMVESSKEEPGSASVGPLEVGAPQVGNEYPKKVMGKRNE